MLLFPSQLDVVAQKIGPMLLGYPLKMVGPRQAFGLVLSVKDVTVAVALLPLLVVKPLPTKG